MAEKRPEIPPQIKRAVRQRCGFGCVICGLPLYEYDHMIEYSIVKEHTEENLTLLCDKHHREKTNKLLSLKQVSEANKNPYNIINGQNSPYLLNFAGTDFSIILGDVRQSVPSVNPNNDFIIPFLVNNKKLISFEIINGKLFFNLVLIDSENNLLLKIVENELVYSAEQWDVEFAGRRLKIRTGLRKIIFDMEILIPNSVQIHKAEFNCDGYWFKVENGGFTARGFNIMVKNITGILIFAAGEYDERYPTIFRG